MLMCFEQDTQTSILCANFSSFRGLGQQIIPLFCNISFKASFFVEAERMESSNPVIKLFLLFLVNIHVMCIV